MTQIDEVVGAVSGSHHLSALARLVARTDELASDAWGRRALLSRRAASISTVIPFNGDICPKKPILSGRTADARLVVVSATMRWSA